MARTKGMGGMLRNETGSVERDQIRENFEDPVKKL